MRVLAFVLSAVGVAGNLRLLKKSTVPAGEVFLSDSKVFGSGASGTVPAIGECVALSDAQQTSTTEPRIKVCGTSLKVTAFLKNGCADYKSVDIGSCDSSKPASTCVEVDPKSAEQAGFQHFQSYKIDYCGEWAT